MTTALDRVAGAPISWGVCEAPNWGEQLPADVVLADMAELGLTATELGPTGYLGADSAAVRRTLDTHGLRLVGGFLPVVLHAEPTADLTEAEAAIRTLAEAGADRVVLSADLGPSGYEQRTELDEAGWRNLLGNLDRTTEIAARHGLAASLHPHVGTAIESEAAVRTLVERSDIPLCLDTGHLMVGGTDPVQLTREIPERIGHVHLKDVRAAVADQVRRGELGFAAAVRNGLFAPLGDGDVDIAGIVKVLRDAGYRGWYVLEQDTALDEADSAVAVADTARSLAYVRSVLAG